MISYLHYRSHVLLDSLYTTGYNMLKSRIGMRIKKLREQKGWTQDRLAKKAGLHRVGLAKIESGDRPNPGILTVKKLARALGVEIAELLD